MPEQIKLPDSFEEALSLIGRKVDVVNGGKHQALTVAGVITSHIPGDLCLLHGDNGVNARIHSQTLLYLAA